MKTSFTHLTAASVLALSLLTVSFGSHAQTRTSANTTTVTLSKSEFGSDPTHWNSLTDVHEGIFGVRNLMGQWSFYTINGGLIAKDAGKVAHGSQPRFNDGVCLLKTNNGFKILYSNGTSKEFDKKKFAAMEEFVDGVSMVKSFDAKYKPTVYYIDKDGNKIWPHLARTGTSITDMMATEPVRRLSDNLRAVKVGGKWGYIDKDGAIRIKPQFDMAGDFSEGYAWVMVTVNGKKKIGLIDSKGVYSIQPEYDGFEGNIDREFGPVSNGIARVALRDKLLYLHPTGIVKAEYADAHGTNFNNGYAFVQNRKKSDWGIIHDIIDTDMHVVGEINTSEDKFDTIDNFSPRFSKDGYASIDHQHAIGKSSGAIVLIDKEHPENITVRDVSDDGYAYAETRNGDSVTRGFINVGGDYYVIFDVQ